MAALLLPQNAETAFNTGLIALAQGKTDQARAWYHSTTRAWSGSRLLIEQDNARSKALQIALDDLTAFLGTNPRLNWLGQPILEKLQAAADAAESG